MSKSEEKRSRESDKKPRIVNLPPEERSLVNWMKRQQDCSIEEIAAHIGQDRAAAKRAIEELMSKGFVEQREVAGLLRYGILRESKGGGIVSGNFLKDLEKQLGQIKFSTLITLTFITAFLLIPFAGSQLYLPILRDTAFAWHQFLQGDIYKLTTGYIALLFVGLEMLFTLRKRGRAWKINLPGSILLWRGLHIFVGVGLLAIVLVHTNGATGVNFNGIFLWIFFGVTLSALVGVTTETGVLESPRKYFGIAPENARGIGKLLPGMAKGQLIRNMRNIWVSTHIFMVSIFFVMLAVHIFLAYYYQ